MTNIKAKVQKTAVSTLVIVNILMAGAGIGAYVMHQVDAGIAKHTQDVAKELLKSVAPTALAATSPK